MYRCIPDQRPCQRRLVPHAIQHVPSNATWIGDYPKLAMWNSGGSPAQNAYYLTVNLFDGITLGFQGVRVFALDRASMLVGGAANAIAFNITAAGLGDPQQSWFQPAWGGGGFNAEFDCHGGAHRTPSPRTTGLRSPLAGNDRSRLGSGASQFLSSHFSSRGGGWGRYLGLNRGVSVPTPTPSARPP